MGPATLSQIEGAGVAWVSAFVRHSTAISLLALATSRDLVLVLALVVGELRHCCANLHWLSAV
jgi:hypothetical protein